jgi:hypothetical protein
MKRVSVLVLFSIFLYSCGSNTDSKPETISGVYKLKNTGATDQSDPQQKLQYKIYTPTYYFQASVENDSSVMFGIGSYEIINDTIIEHNIYNTDNFDVKKDFKLVFSKSENGYSQVASAMMKDATEASSKEEYDTISLNESASNVDGLWQHVRTMSINGADTSFLNTTEYVIFQSGHYLKASRFVIDSAANQYKNNFWYGTFSLNNKSFTSNCEFSSDSPSIGLKSTSSYLVNEKEGTMIQINTGVAGGATEYKSYRKVK